MIRQFKPRDAASCCRLIHACLESDSSYSETLRRKLCSAETPQSMIERARLYYIAVYESKDQLCGVAGLDMNEIRLMHVSPEMRRHGIGRALLEHLKSMVPGALFSDLFVYASMQSTGFYRACGFMEKGPYCFDFGGERQPTVFMTFRTSPAKE
jgi:GNAT superfamily N-acetyltransferase